MIELIGKVVHDDSVVLFWKKPAGMIPGMRYFVMVDGEMAASVEKTHCTLDGLTAQRRYRIDICAAISKEAALSVTTEDMLSLSIMTAKQKQRIDVTALDTPAIGDGKTLNTAALQMAIDACEPDHVLHFPKGIYRTGALRLRSNMEIYLDQDAVLQGTDREEDYYPRIWSRFEGTEMECFSSVLNLGELNRDGGYSCENVVIRGHGTVASGGRRLAQTIIENERLRTKDYLDALGDRILECENLDTIPGRVRPRLINMSNARNVVLSGITLKDGASWNVHMIYCDNIVTHGCTFVSRDVWNGDGWDPDSSTNSTIFDCDFFTGDDAIAIKSGKNPEGNEINKPCEGISIFDCRVHAGHGIALGSEMSGGIRAISIWDCDLWKSKYGIEIKATKKRGGYVRDIHAQDCTASHILIHSVAYNDDGVGASVPPVIADCCFERIRIKGCDSVQSAMGAHFSTIEIRGFDQEHLIRNIVFRNIQIEQSEVDTGCEVVMTNCTDVHLDNVEVLQMEKRI